MSKFIVKIEYKQKNKETGELETVVEKEYDFIDYCELLYTDLMKSLSEVESAFYAFSDHKQKDDWDPQVAKQFNKIRNKMLDQANAIRRLPQNLIHDGVKANQIPFPEFINRTMR